MFPFELGIILGLGEEKTNDKQDNERHEGLQFRADSSLLGHTLV